MRLEMLKEGETALKLSSVYQKVCHEFMRYKKFESLLHYMNIFPTARCSRDMHQMKVKQVALSVA